MLASVVLLLAGFGCVSATRPDGLAFLESVASRPEVVSLPSSGLLYQVLESGGEQAHPELDDTCYIHFRGTLPDGTEFINSDRRTIAEKGFTVNKTDVADQVKQLLALKRQHVELEQYEKAREIKDQINALGRMVSTGSPAKPMKFVPNKVIPGWRQAMLLMRPGDKWRVWLKSELAYGGASKGDLIKPGEVLVFDLELVRVVEAHWSHAEGVHWWHVGIALLAIVYSIKYMIEMESGTDSRSDTAQKNKVMVSKASGHPNNDFVYLDISVDGQKPHRLDIELFTDICPKTCDNFRALCTSERGFGYQGCPFHRVIKDFMCQGGDITEKNGTGGKSIYGRMFNDEWENGWVPHSQPGMLSMANAGPNTNSSQFFITTARTAHLDQVHVAFGKVTKGMDFVMREMNTNDGTPPSKSMAIVSCGQSNNDN